MTFSVLVEVSLRPGIADPQGATIERSLPTLGFDGVAGVTVGKAIRFLIEAPDADAPRPGQRAVRAVPDEPGHRAGVRHGGCRLMSVGVVLFPGTNCEADVVEA